MVSGRAALVCLAATIGACVQVLDIPERIELSHWQCNDGACACEDGWGDCDEDADNGCETDLLTSEDDCGACNVVCESPFPVCKDGGCDCPPDGCESPFPSCEPPCALFEQCIDMRCIPVP